MSTKTHTPGPWKVFADGEIVYDDGDVQPTIATVNFENTDEAQADADARLIAAAPELLAELRALTHLAEVLNNRQHAGLRVTPAMWAELYQLTNRSAAVIAKAADISHLERNPDNV